MAAFKEPDQDSKRLSASTFLMGPRRTTVPASHHPADDSFILSLNRRMEKLERGVDDLILDGRKRAKKG